MASLADILATVQQGVTAVNGLNSQLAKLGNAWTPYTPVITAGSGTVVATATGRYSRIGKTVFIQMTITMSSGGAGASYVAATLPVPSNTGFNYMMTGREASAGKMQQAVTIPPSSNLLGFINYDNTYPGINGGLYYITGVYEAA